MATGYCTIISKNYISRARALAASIRRFHPDAEFHVLLVDRVDGFLTPEQEPFQITPLESLPIEQLQRFCFQYNILELNTAAKPYFLEHLFATSSLEKWIYLDPDILVLNSLSHLDRLLESHDVLLTPHSTVPYPEEEEKREIDILKAGTFNLGFIAMKRGETAEALLNWWKKRLYSGCRSDLSQGYHVDQKWIDLVPSFFEGVHIIKEPGFNVATWNFHAYSFHVEGGVFFANDQPIKFFHFSAFDPLNLNVVSRYQSRYTMENIGVLKNLFFEYSRLLKEQGYEETVKWPYAFACFSNGIPIPDRLRSHYLLMKNSESFGNPFDSTPAGSLYHWWITKGEGMKREELTELLNIDPQDWQFDQIAGAVESLDLYDWFRRGNTKPRWQGISHVGTYLKQQVKYRGVNLLMQWLPPLFAKQFVLNRLLMEEIRKLRGTKV